MASVSIVNLSEVKQNGWRLDGEYWKDYHSKSAVQYIKLGDIAKISGGKRLPLGEKFSDVGIPYIRAEDVKGFVDYNDSPKISEDLHQKIKKYQTKYNDVLLTIVGNSIGDIGIVKFELEKCNLTENAAKIYNLKNFLPEFLFIFFQTKYGQSQIKKESVGTAQPKLALCRIGEMKIPLLTHTFQTKIEQTVKTAHQLLEASKTAYKTAENLLLDEVFGNWKPATHKNWHVKMLSEVQSAGRMDAEYFHAKYEDLLSQIKGYKGGWCELGEVCDLIGHPSNPPYAKENDNEKIFIITQKHLGKITPDDNFFDDKDALYTNQEFEAKNPQYILQEGDLLMYSVGAYIGKVNIYNENKIKATIASFLTLIRTNKVNPYFLTVLFNLPSFIELSQRRQRGLAQQYLYPYDIKQLIIPLIPQPLQAQIATLVKQSFEDRTQSKALLQLAKTAVEKAIEEGEEAGLTEINSIKLICQPN